MPTVLPTIAVIHETNKLTPDQVAAYCNAQAIQLTRDFLPIWGLSASVVRAPPGRPLPAGAWPLYLRDHTGADDLGNHATVSGVPYGQVGVADCDTDGSSWAVDASHELLEMLIDPLVQSFTTAPDGWTYTKEVCDAVQDDRWGYKINGVLMTSFVTPSWFLMGSSGPFVFPSVSSGELKGPFDLAPGGYIQRIKPGDKAWSMVTPLGERLSRRQTKDQNPASRAGRRGV